VLDRYQYCYPAAYHPTWRSSALLEIWAGRMNYNKKTIWGWFIAGTSRGWLASS